MPIPKLPLYLTGLLYPYHRAWWRRTLQRRSAISAWNERHAALFVHIPKTAGTSVLAGLGMEPAFDTHAPAAVYRAVYPELFARAHKFAFVRNPWDRFASSFHFMKMGTEWPMQMRWAEETIGDMDFRTFTLALRRPMFRARVMAERFFWPQTFWLHGRGDRPLVDEIFRFEALDAGMAQLCDRFGLERPAVTPHLRKVEKPDFRALYDDEMRAIVGQLYRRDIATLGYRFESDPASSDPTAPSA